MDAPTSSLLAHERLFAELGQDLGIEGLAFNEAGVCVMSFDEIVLRFEYQPERDEILVSSEIGALHEAAPHSIFRELLAFNAVSAAGGGGGVGYDSENGVVVWFDRLAPRLADQQVFQKWIEAAIVRHESWRDVLRDLQTSRTADPATADMSTQLLRI